MKLVRFGAPGREKPGILSGEVRRDASASFRDWDREFFERGGLEKLGSVNHLGPVEVM